MEHGKVKDAVYDRSVRRPLKALRDAENIVSRDAVQMRLTGGGLFDRRAGAGPAEEECSETPRVPVTDAFGNRWSEVVRQSESFRLTGAGAAGEGLLSSAAADAVSLAMGRLAAAGAVPEYVDLQVFWPQDAPEELMKAQMKAVAALCARYQVKVGSCDVSAAAIPLPLISAHALGIRGSLFVPEPAEEAQDLIMAGYAGLGGSRRLALHYREALCSHFHPAFFDDLMAMEDHCILKAAAVAAGAGVKAMTACGEGGIFTGAWELARQSGLGLRIMLKKILLRQETVEICDYLNVSPYSIYSDGALLMTAVHGQKVLEAMAVAGIPAAIIGHMTGDHDRVIINDEETRFLEPFKGEEMPDQDKI